ncbi:unnamed protein product [Adineta steineri]|uniref:DUF2252 domain-containing protein n=1 Tax=Adineta steineri TaxID=433720 RepID=A0A819Q214_9BILA|nr:unnamed protein product [Adineta steineri]CAF3737112.1 unnamed protein product [Adineta steineri]CAF4027716.1 unnamed protein product [Adineta steineri]
MSTPSFDNPPNLLNLENDEERTNYIIDTFIKNFGEGMRANPKGWRGRCRKMAANEFAFFRGSAVLFYRDLHRTLADDPWLKRCKKASSMFIHGDLHAENFGTYIDRFGLIDFSVNDFDEGYVGPFTWDIKRLVASLNLVTFSKAYCDKKIEKIITCVVRSYLARIYEYCKSPEEYKIPLTSENTEGPINILLKESRLGSKEAHLDTMTTVENYERRFIRSDIVKDVPDDLRHQLLLAFQEYIRTIPESKREPLSTYRVKDIVARASPGIGSAGAISYNILIQGKTQALETDVVIFMKPAKKSAVATVLNTPELEQYFKHDGLRTVLCGYAMHAVTTKWLGYSTLNNEIPLFVDEVATHNKDLDWTDINDFEQICQTAEFLGKAMAKIHCIADVDSAENEQHVGEHTYTIPFHLIPRHSEITIRDAIGGNDEAFVNDIVAFAMAYGNAVRRDHRLFFEAFRNEQIPIINEYQSQSEQHQPPPVPQSGQ